MPPATTAAPNEHCEPLAAKGHYLRRRRTCFLQAGRRGRSLAQQLAAARRHGDPHGPRPGARPEPLLGRRRGAAGAVSAPAQRSAALVNALQPYETGRAAARAGLHRDVRAAAAPYARRPTDHSAPLTFLVALTPLLLRAGDCREAEEFEERSAGHDAAPDAGSFDASAAGCEPGYVRSQPDFVGPRACSDTNRRGQIFLLREAGVGVRVGPVRAGLLCTSATCNRAVGG